LDDERPGLKPIKLLSLTLIVVFAAVVFKVFNGEQLYLWLESELKNDWVLGGIYIFTLYQVLSLLGVPVSPITLLCGAILGFEKTLVIMLPSLISITLILFLVGKYILGNKLAAVREEKPKVNALLNVIESSPFKWFFLIRISGVSPFAISSYFICLTQIPIKKLIVPSLLGTIPHLIMQCYIGSLGGELLNGNSDGVGFKVTFAGIGILILGITSYKIKKAYQRELNNFTIND
jgi:uncharacterized membrane protein YdjX (TVP38/TMEM64 family)